MKAEKNNLQASVWPKLPPAPPREPKRSAQMELADFVESAEYHLVDPWTRPILIEISDELLTWYGSPVKALADRMKAMKAKGYKVRIVRWLFTNYVEVDWEV